MDAYYYYYSNDDILVLTDWQLKKAIKEITQQINMVTYLLWLTSTKDPILDVVNEMCSSPMTISNSLRKKKKKR